MFLARDPDRSRSVAVKVLQLDITPEQAAELAAQVARLAHVNLAHPSIVAPIDAGLEGSLPYLVADLLSAESLDAAIRQYGPAPPGQAMRILTSIAAAMDFAASVGVNHGALHPRDVLVTPDDTHITGLGVGRALETIGLRAPMRRPYVAPERVQRESWDGRADVYSLGVLARELLVGRSRLDRDSDADSRLAEEQADRLLPVFAKATAARPADRFSAGLELVGALQDALGGTKARRAPAVVRPDQNEPPPRDSRARHTHDLLLPLETEVEQEGGDLPVASPSRAEADAQALAELAPSANAAGESVDALAYLDIDRDRSDAGQPAAAVSLTGVEDRATADVPDVAPDRFTDDSRFAVEDGEEEEQPEDVSRQAAEPTPAAVGGELEPVVVDEPDATPSLESDVEAAEGRPGGLELRFPDEVEQDVPFRDDVEPPREMPDEVEPVADLSGEVEPGGALPDSTSTPLPPGLSAPIGEGAPTPPGAGTDAPVDPGLLVEATRDRPRSLALPLALMLVVGLALGGVGGYLLGVGQSRGDAPAANASASPAEPAAGAPLGQVAPPPRPTAGALRDIPAGSPAGKAAPSTAKPSTAETAAPSGARAGATTQVNGVLLVRSTPTGANVTVNGRSRGRTPLRVRNLPAGKYTVRVSRQGYTSEERAVSLSTQQPSSTLTFSLERSGRAQPGPRTEATSGAAAAARAEFYGSLSVESLPTGARVFLDGRQIGTTPLVSARVPAGSHVVRVDRTGFLPWTTSIQVASGQRVRVTASLERESR